MVFICHNQNIWRHNELSKYKLYDDENIGLKLQLQSSFSICLILHKLYRWIIILAQKIIDSLLNQMFYINLNFIKNDFLH